MPPTAEPENVYLSYYVLFTAGVGFFGWFALNFNPGTIRQNYMPAHRTQFTPLAARALGAWFLLCGVARYGAWHYWGEKGWYDIGMVSLALPLWHYAVETVGWGSVTWAQIVETSLIDGVGLVWMLMARKNVLGI